MANVLIRIVSVTKKVKVMDKFFQQNISNCSIRMSQINETLQYKVINNTLTNKDSIDVAMELLYFIEDAHRYAIQEIERQILHTCEKLHTHCYSELFNYYKAKEKWNLDVIEKIIKIEKTHELPVLNMVCQDNKEFLTLIGITAIESNIEEWNINLYKEDALKSLNYYSKLILCICPDKIKQNTIASLDNIKTDLIESYNE